jgi:hypothetical protein
MNGAWDRDRGMTHGSYQAAAIDPLTAEFVSEAAEKLNRRERQVCPQFRHAEKRLPEICLGMIGSKKPSVPTPNVITGQSPARDNYLLIIVP